MGCVKRHGLQGDDDAVLDGHRRMTAAAGETAHGKLRQTSRSCIHSWPWKICRAVGLGPGRPWALFYILGSSSEPATVQVRWVFWAPLRGVYSQ